MRKDITARELIALLSEVEESKKDLPVYIYGLKSGNRYSIDLDVPLDDSTEEYLDLNINEA